MSQLNSMAIPMEGKYSNSELLELKNKMNAKGNSGAHMIIEISTLEK